MTPINEVRIPIKLDRDASGQFIPRVLIFSINTMRAYEEASGKVYWDTVLGIFDIYDQFGPKLQAGESVVSEAEMKRSSLAILRKIRATDIHMLLWASLHDYVYQRNKAIPYWPLSLDEIGRLVNPWDAIPLLGLIIQGIRQNSPNAAELGEASGDGKVIVMPPAEATPTATANGGEPSIELAADAFG